jgi:diguanylate cyclase (GGDEF)-like protein/PAS domain S-box-containing protein
VTNVRRSVLEKVLDVVRELGATDGLEATLELIARSSISVLGFGAAAINVSDGAGQLWVEAVAGPPQIYTLLGASSTEQLWLDLLESAEKWANLRFLSHDVDKSAFRGVPMWASGEPVPTADSERWHPDDTLLAPMWEPSGRLLGVLSVDQPVSGLMPDLEQRTILELFAAQAAIAITDSRAWQVSERKRIQAEGHWKLTFERSPIGAAIVATDGTIVQANDTLVTLLGYPAEALNGMRVLDITHPADVDANLELFLELLNGERDSYEMEKRFIHAAGHSIWGLLRVGAIRDADGGIVSIISQIADITDRKTAEQELARRTSHDTLTSLPNRSLIEDKLNAQLSAGLATGVLFLDLDRFKTVNDSLGHDAGDELLVVVADKLLAAVGSRFEVGRIGGDEFVVLAPGIGDPLVLTKLGIDLMADFEKPLRIRGHEHTVSLSVGVTVTRATHRHADEVLREADQAMLRAKRQGRARIEMFDPAQDRPATVQDLRLEQALRVSLAQGIGLVPYFQQIVDLADNTVAGYEALVRWNHPDLGLLEPAAFLPMAEKTGLIVPLGWWMLSRSCAALKDAEFSDQGRRWVAVNVSGSQLGRGLLVGAVQQVLSESGLPAEQLHLEITETALIEASAASIREVRAVAELGVQVALDDFGTGYSSLTLLRDLPVSVVKIDRSFISPIGVDRSATAIVRRVIALCQELGVVTVAEGVETQSQLTALRALGCTQAQGYLIGPPEPFDLSPSAQSLHRRRSSA